VATTRLTIARAPGPVVLVGHSYGGVVVTEAGTDSKVAGLVYIAAFTPDKWRNSALESLIKNPPPGAPVPPILAPQDGYLFLDKAKFRASFAADVSEAKAASWPTLRCRGALRLFSGAVSEPAGRPTWKDRKQVPGSDRGQDDPAARSAPDGQHAAARLSRRLPAATRSIFRSPEAVAAAHCQGGEERELQKWQRERKNGSQLAQSKTSKKTPRAIRPGLTPFSSTPC